MPSEENPLDKNFSLIQPQPDVFRFTNLWSSGAQSRKAAYGGLIMAQAMCAADETAPTQLKAHCVQVFYVTNAHTDRPIDCVVERVFDGRSFATRTVNQRQDGRTTLNMQISYHAVEPDSCVHQSEMPNVKGPEECEEADFDVVFDDDGNETIHKDIQPAAHGFVVPNERVYPFHFRIVDLDALLGKTEVIPKCHYMWTKFKFPIAKDADRLHRAALLFISDLGLTVSSYRPHNRNGFKFSMNFSLNHSVHFHVPVFDASDWILMEFESTKSKNARSITRARYWNRQGELIATVCQESLIRSRGPVSRL